MLKLILWLIFRNHVHNEMACMKNCDLMKKCFLHSSVELTLILKEFVATISMFECGENNGMLKLNRKLQFNL